MIASRTLIKVAASLILGVGVLTGQTQAQSYYYSGPDNGQADIGLNPSGNNSIGYFDIYFGSLSETLNYNAAAQTLSTVGSVSVSPTSGIFNMVQNGEDNILGNATLTIGNNGTISLNGTYTHTFGSDYVGDLVIPVSGTGTYEGQSFSANWNVELPVVIAIDAATPTSLTFDEGADVFGGPESQGMVSGQTVIPELGLTDGAEIDNSIWYQWDVDPVASCVPDGGDAVVLLGIGMASLAVWRRRISF